MVIGNRLLKVCISAIYFFLAYLGKTLQIFFRKNCNGTLVILTYHSIKPTQQNKFIEHLQVIERISKPVFADIKSPLPANTHHIAVTFDDGFVSFLEYGLPELQKKNIPATLFVPSGYLGQKPGWIKNPHHANAQETVMTADQLKSLPDKLIRVGSHSKTHPRMTHIGWENFETEIAGSKKALEAKIGNDITLFAFPYNDFNQQCIDLVYESGYDRAFSNVPTFPATNLDSFLIGRVDVSPDDWKIEFWLKAMGAFQWLPFAIIIKYRIKKFLLRNRLA